MEKVLLLILAFGIDLLFSLALVALACYTIHAFIYIRPKAVFLGRLYIIVIFISNLLTLLSGDMEDVGWGSLSQVVKGSVWGLIRFVYLSVSNQVAELFPKENRRIFKRDKYFAGSLLTIPALLFFIYLFVFLGNIGITPLISSDAGEYTDEVVAFRVPGYDICTRQINHSMLRMQSVEYVTDPRLVWTFAALYSPETGKACIVSCFAAIPEKQAESLVNDILHTMRFK